jgi:peroxiredoxin
VQTGERVPDFTLPDLQGRIHILGDYRGRIVVLNFWSAECPYSGQADARLLEFSREWGEAVVVLNVASNDNESREQVAAAVRGRKLPVILYDERHRVADQFAAQTTPHCFVIDGQGLLRYQGAFDDTSLRRRQPVRFHVKEAVDALLAGRSPDPASIQPFGCAIVRIMLE